MKFELKAYTIQEYGKRTDAFGRPHQEDSIYPTFGRAGESDRLFILCDGMGGHDAGEVASAAVCEAMSETVFATCNSSEGAFEREDFNKALSSAYDALDRKDTGNAHAMGTTLTFLKLHSHGAFIAHIGDSRVYHIRPGKDAAHTEILHETADHSWVAQMVKAGEMTREEAHHSNRKNQITRAMQPSRCGQRCIADIYETDDIRDGDYFYLCSDGMLEQDDMDSGEALKHIFSAKGGNDEARVNALRTATAGNSDNHTAIIVHIIAVKKEKPASTPPAMPTPQVGSPTAQKMPPTNSSGRYFIMTFMGFIIVALVAIGAYFVYNFVHAGDATDTSDEPVAAESSILQPDKTTEADKILNEAEADTGEDIKAEDDIRAAQDKAEQAENGRTVVNPSQSVTTPTAPNNASSTTGNNTQNSNTNTAETDVSHPSTSPDTTTTSPETPSTGNEQTTAPEPPEPATEPTPTNS